MTGRSLARAGTLMLRSRVSKVRRTRFDDGGDGGGDLKPVGILNVGGATRKER